MLLLTTAPFPSLWGLANTFLITNLGLSKQESYWFDSDIIIFLIEKEMGFLDILLFLTNGKKFTKNSSETALI